MSTSIVKGLTDRELEEMRFYLLGSVEAHPSRMSEFYEVDAEQTRRRTARAYSRPKVATELRVTLAYLSEEDFV